VRRPLSQKELVEKYVLACWILKIRLISARRYLWAPSASLVHVETGILQMRKACESIGYMCVVATEIEGQVRLEKLRKMYQVGKLLKLLQETGTERFPLRAKLSGAQERAEQGYWQLIFENKAEDIVAVGRIHSNLGELLHEFGPFKEWPKSGEQSIKSLASLLEGSRKEHQWLWNRFWQHAIELRGKMFFVNLGEQTNSLRPSVLLEGSLVAEDLEIEFDPEFLADFTGEVSWDECKN
jgi:hypothetical protein